jgi:hypothetical protein
MGKLQIGRDGKGGPSPRRIKPPGAARVAAGSGGYREGRGAASQPFHGDRQVAGNDTPAHRLHHDGQPGHRLGSGSKHVGK